MATAQRMKPDGCKLVVIGGSAGAIGPLSDILARLPADFRAAVIVVQHSDPSRESLLAPILGRRSKLPVHAARDGDAIQPGHVYVIPPDRHARGTTERTIHLSDGSRIRRVRSSANPLFESAAAAYGAHVVAIVLSGTGMDATNGVQTVRHHGGVVIAQSAESAQHFGMPGSAIATGMVDYVLEVEAMPDLLQRLAK